MSKTKIFLTFLISAIILFISGICIFSLSVYFGEQTKDPDAYEVLGWFIMLAMIGMSLILFSASLGFWFCRQSKIIKLL